jgi:hypothetical protein
VAAPSNSRRSPGSHFLAEVTSGGSEDVRRAGSAQAVQPTSFLHHATQAVPKAAVKGIWQLFGLATSDGG